MTVWHFALPIRLRMALWSAALVTATLAVAAYVVNVTLRDALLRDVDTTLEERAVQIEWRVTGSPDEPLEAPPQPIQMAVDAIEEFAAPGVYFQVYDASGKLLASSSNLPVEGLPRDDWAVAHALQGKADLTILPGGRARLRVLTRPLVAERQTVGAIRVAASLQLLDAFLQRFEQLVLLVGIGGVVLSLVGGWALATRSLAPVVEMTRLARETAADAGGEIKGTPLTVPPMRDEIGVLAMTFNEMLARLRAAFRRQREFLADTSHELRNPLMVVRANLDLLELDLPPEERRDCLREAREEVDRMTRLISDLLFLTEADARDAIAHGRVDLGEVARATVRRSAPLAPDGLVLRAGLLDSATVLGDRDRLRQLLSNLVENAIRYTSPPGEVIVSVRRKGDRAEVSVADTGIGIPPEHHARIFDRFYRLDQARTRSLGGSGLGLAIVRQIAEAHGGQVRITSAVGEGSEFVIELPLAPLEAELAEAPVDARVVS
ncbi:MAG TPA: ATP-binding protein [Chloroflexota bacterium]|nr:ATP-binding protein [Chloroflexota bacterium]